jgi:endonuclease III
MATPNRAALIGRTLKVLRKHFKPVPPVKDRTLLEHLLFACLLEDSPHEAAEQVFATLKRDYFDWNEVRVSTIRELNEVLKPLVNSPAAAARLKQTLHSVFESVYQFDIETLKKQNIGQTVKQLEKYNGTSPFVVAYVTQMALGGHAIPISQGALIALHTVGVISDDEFNKRAVPGLERAVPKSKGIEVGSLMHQLGVEVGRNPYGQNARKLLLEIDPNCKDRLPKRATQRPAQPPAPPSAPAPAPAKGKAGAHAPAKGAGAKKKATEAKPEARVEKSKPAEKPKKKPTPAPPKSIKRPTKQGAKHATKRGAKTTTSRGLAKRKPR